MEGGNQPRSQERVGDGDHRNSRVIQKSLRPCDELLAECVCKLIRSLVREQCRSFDAGRPRKHQPVTTIGFARIQQTCRTGSADERSDEERSGHPRGDFGVSADQGDAEVGAARLQLFEEIGNEIGRRPNFWEEGGDEHPSRYGAEAGQIVRIDVDQIDAGFLADKCDGVVLDD